MKLEKEELIDGNVYMIKCVTWGYKSPYIWKNDLFYGDTDFYNGLCYEYDDLLSIEEINQNKDTLQEVVEWCIGVNNSVMIVNSEVRVSVERSDGGISWKKIDTNKLLEAIRTENKELTELKALAEKLGYELTKK